MESLENWLNEQLQTRGWSQSEAARRSGISPSMFSQVISGAAKPGPDFLTGIAQAFSITRREAFQRAGMIESEPPTDTPTIQEMNQEFAYLTAEEQEFWVGMLKSYVAERKRGYTASPQESAV
jgi:transcriptional regulator with XRE-family HTH domain